MDRECGRRYHLNRLLSLRTAVIVLAVIGMTASGRRVVAQSASELRWGGDAEGGAPFQEQDAKRRLGGFETAGEHSRQQPGPLNDGQQHSR